ncbi:MAG: hypothetical protein EOP53_21575 [Sphingobacteriales bacterium]|nr:MAG: hypothetical protein EOP53_21575 [Sphingobacteriales bacterium]
MDDLGAKFSREKGFCFDRIIIQEIIFDDTNDVTLFCTVPYYGEMYVANFGLSFEQLNVILRSINKSDGSTIATAIAEKLKGEIEIPSVIEVVTVYGKPLEVNNCILYTTLYDISDDDDEMEDDEDFDDNDEEIFGPQESEEEDDEDYEAYAFLIDEIRLKQPLN